VNTVADTKRVQIELPEKLAKLVEVYDSTQDVGMARALERYFEERGEEIPKLCPYCYTVMAWSTGPAEFRCGDCDREIEAAAALDQAELLAQRE
jgi:tRNA(Ile2) C34 agmatinyltransferase TiaS